MTIIVAHNFYQQPGGEDEVFAAEVDLLRRFGHNVHTFTMDNHRVNAMGRARALAATIWNRDSYRALRELVSRTGATIVHFHNTFPLISPAGYAAARDAGAAVVQTLHNYRLICPCALLLRHGHPCEYCVGRAFAWPGVAHGCYRGSRPATAAVAGMTAAHRLRGTWESAVDVYIAPTEFARTKLIQGGLPAGKIVVKPNFVDPDPGVGTGCGGYALFVGRLSHEKGVETLLDAWRELGDSVPLKIVGDGPLSSLVGQAAASQPNIEWLGRRPLAEVYDLIGNATVLVSPSRCYETFGRVIVESFAKGTPVIGPGHGASADLIRHEVNGMLFEPGSAHDLANCVRTLCGDPQMQARMRSVARREYELHYTGPRNHEQLSEIYARAIATSPVPASAALVRPPATEVQTG